MVTTKNLNDARNLASKLFFAAWIDFNIDQGGPSQSIKDQFEPLSPLIDRWLYYNNVDDFSAYIQRHNDVRLIAVMTAGVARELVPKHSNSDVLESIYIFCFDIGRARDSFANEPKVKGIFNVENELYEKIVDDLATKFVETGVTFAQIDDRHQARTYYEEAKRLLSTPIKHLTDEEKRTRLDEIEIRFDQLIA